ncbi:MAG TPA: hypothetical protein VIO33_02145 [Burkholderiaceae bacterium]
MTAWFGPFHNPTQLAGFTSFFAAAIAAGLAARFASNPATRRHWGWIAAIQLMLAAEVMLDLRYLAHDAIDRTLSAFGVYESRRPIQLVLLAIVALLAGWLVVRRWAAAYESQYARAAEFATFAALLDFAVETVSLHQVDAVLYRSIGPVLLNGWLWTATALAVVVSVLTERWCKVVASA